ncbi:MAG: VIT domain-containing protein, partial [Planctomycetota bacterium]
CDITDAVAVTRIDQTFYNPNSRQVEGTYIFPLDDDIALSKFSMFVGGKEIQGQVLDRDEARRIYESIVARKRDPALLEYVGTRMYKARIFPIPPNGDVRVKLEYSQILNAEAGMVRYRYPLGTEKFSSAPLEQVSVVVAIESKTPIKSVFCPTHSMSIKRASDTHASASFEAKQVKPDRDLVLYYTLSEKEFGLALLSYREAGQDGFFLARIAPKAVVDAADIVPKDICFVLDTSGSMAGDKIVQAKKALSYCLSSLNPADRFHLVRFSHEASVFTGGLQEATSDNVERAKRFVEGISAEGGTNINEALSAALKPRATQPDAERPFLIVFLTDGQPTVGVTEPTKILQNVTQANVHGVRLFVFGIGDDVNTHLLDKLAQQNHGARDYVGNREDLEIKLSNFYRKVADPVLANLQLTWHKLPVRDLYPQQLADLFSGSEVVLVGRYTGSGAKAVELHGDRRGTRERHVYEAQFAESDTRHDFLPRLWATRKVGYLLDQIRLHGENKELVDAVAQLAIKYGIVTPYTAYLVNEQQQLITQRGGRPHVLDRMLQEAARFGANGGSGGGGPGRGRVTLGRKFKKARRSPAGGVAVADSKEALMLQTFAFTDLEAEVTVLDDLAERDEAGKKVNSVRQVASRTFYYEKGVWIDGSYQEGTATRKIEAFGEEYFALAGGDRRAAQYLATGPRVIFLLDGVVYDTVATE